MHPQQKICKLSLNLTISINILHNLFNCTLTTTKSQLLNKGLDYNLYSTRLNIQHVRAEFENLHSKLRNLLYQCHIAYCFSKNSYPCIVFLYPLFIMIDFVDLSNSVLSHDQKEALYFLRNDPNIVITGPDKGNSVVILNRCDYVNKMYDISNDVSKFLPCNHDISLVNLTKFQRSIYYLKTKKAFSDEIYFRIHPT